jgi:ATP-dependent Lon protease
MNFSIQEMNRNKKGGTKRKRVEDNEVSEVDLEPDYIDGRANDNESDREAEVEDLDSDYDEKEDSIETDKPEEYEKLDKNTKKQFDNIKKDINQDEISFSKILNSDVLQEDKKELFQLYEVYCNIPDEVSKEKLDMRKELKNKYEQALKKYVTHQKYTNKEHETFRKELETLENYNEIEEVKYDIVKLQTSIKNKQIIYGEYKRMNNMNFTDDELPKLKLWLKWALSLPYDRMKTVNMTQTILTKFLQDVRRRLDEELYGMEKVKEQILIFLNSRILNPNMKKCSLGLLGEPGVGKTTIVKLLASILDFPMEQISLGGVKNSDYLKGHQYTYIGSEPGEIVKCLCRMKAKNGILFFDEYDKISDNKEVCASLLHITDSTQNSSFQDNFLSGISIDLSNIWFFYSMNEKPTDSALADRIYYINVDGYTKEDKFYIVRDYLLKKAHRNLNWKEGSLTFTDECIRSLIISVGESDSSGIRSLDDTVNSICNKINFLCTHQNKNGKLNINSSFDLNRKISFPFVLEKNMLNSLLEK